LLRRAKHSRTSAGRRKSPTAQVGAGRWALFPCLAVMLDVNIASLNGMRKGAAVDLRRAWMPGLSRAR
jgi:hypothetical protein